MYYHILDKQEKVLASNLPTELLADFSRSCIGMERLFCNVRRTEKRHGKIQTEYGIIYLCSYDSDLTNKIFKRYLEASKFFHENLSQSKNEISNFEKQKTRRLKHNLVTHCTNILQEIYRLIPQESLAKGGKLQTEIIREKITKDSRSASLMILRVLKNANLMKSEFDVYDMLHSDTPYLEFHLHEIHKVVILTLNSFWLDLVEKGCNVNVSNCDALALIDYKSMSVALCHLFDNTTKYTAPDSDISIRFENGTKTVKLLVEMTSLKVEKEEVQKIFEENFSGKYSKELDLCGDGIGMHIMKRLVELNKGKIYFQNNVDPKRNLVYKDKPYQRNRIIIELINL